MQEKSTTIVEVSEIERSNVSGEFRITDVIEAQTGVQLIIQNSETKAEYIIEYTPVDKAQKLPRIPQIGETAIFDSGRLVITNKKNKVVYVGTYKKD